MPRKTVAPFYQSGFPSAEVILNFEKHAQAHSVEQKKEINKSIHISCIKTSAQQIDNKSPTYELDIYALVANY